MGSMGTEYMRTLVRAHFRSCLRLLEMSGDRMVRSPVGQLIVWKSRDLGCSSFSRSLLLSHSWSPFQRSHRHLNFSRMLFLRFCALHVTVVPSVNPFFSRVLCSWVLFTCRSSLGPTLRRTRLTSIAVHQPTATFKSDLLAEMDWDLGRMVVVDGLRA
ncbi:hypothetical protein C8F01DRAFT_574758 [Mycena amicta]|nr:hypothetical protein C8F01DRAFT_574758 [Mycena amicta]